MEPQEIKIKDDILKIIPLGGGCEVGRSCIIVKFKGKTVMLDCGIHPSDNDLSSLPFFDKIDASTVDLLLVTHFHLDHCGSVPYFLEKTNFKGSTYMTYPTKAIYKQVVLDSLKVGMNWGQESLFSRDDILNTMDKIKALNFHEEIEEKGIKFVAYNAGHVIGAAMFIVEICGVRILYTGDYSREKDIHIRPAEIPKCEIDVLIVESTYGIKCHQPRQQREKFFLETVERIVKRKGKCLLPVFVLGRAQELLLILEDYWESKPELQNVPIYYASTMMARCMLIFKTYVNMMGKEIKEQMKKGKNPFDFKFISILKIIDAVEDVKEAMVVMASPGMLQKGLSRTLFQRWCHDSNNGVLFTGYCVENTFARDILNGLKEFKKENGQNCKVEMSVEYISFSAHADFQQTKEFIEAVNPKLVVLVHGEKHEAQKLKKALEDYFDNDKEKKIKFESPNNWNCVELKIKKKEKCQIIGSLVDEVYRKDNEKYVEGKEDSEDKTINGVIFKKGYKYFLTKPKEVNLLIKDKFLKLDQKIHLVYPHSLDLAFYLIQQILPDSTILKMKDGKTINIRNSILIRKKSEKELILEWTSSKKNDIIGDCIGYMLYNMAEYEDLDIFGGVSSSTGEKGKNDEKKKIEFLNLIENALKQNCGKDNVRRKNGFLFIEDKSGVLLKFNEKTLEVMEFKNEILKRKVQNLVNIVFFN